MLKEKGGGGDHGRGAGRRDRKVCRELGENHTPHVGTDVDTPGGHNCANSLLVTLISLKTWHDLSQLRVGMGR